MSEFQYYEFLALDRPLGPEDIAYVRTLSSRVQPTPSHAVFTYSWGSFRGSPLDLLAKHYDMLLHLANWGTKQLAFRFPKTAIDRAILLPYYVGVEEIELTTAGDYLILDIAFHEEGGGWIEEEPQIAPLAPLRDDILRGDLRALYLAWLKSASQYADDEYDAGDGQEDEPDGLIEPPVPPGLDQLSAPLQSFDNFFEIDQDLVVAAAQGSPPLQPTSEPTELQIGPRQFREPDILMLRDITDPRYQDAFWLGADIVVEVVSSDWPERDTEEQPRDYAEAGIPEYWIVNPLNSTITVLALEDDTYDVFGVFHRSEHARSKLLVDFNVSVDEVFDAR